MSTRIQYLKDPENPKRVLTLVSRVKPGTDLVEYGYSVNRPQEWKGDLRDRFYRSQSLTKGDMFSKEKGRMIATGRMESESAVLTANMEGRKPMYAVIETLADASENSVIRRICDNYKSVERLRAILRQQRERVEGERFQTATS